MADSDRVEVGRFVYENGKVSGPADYMREQGFERIRQIEAGNDVVFNTAMGHAPSPLYAELTGMTGAPLSPSPVVAVLVSLQTDYAGWHGVRTLGRDGRS